MPASNACRRILAVLMIAVMSGPGTYADEDEPVARVFAEWRQRRQRLPSVQYSLRGTRVWTRGSFNEDPALVPPWQEPSPDNPERDLTGPVRRTALLDLARNRFRIDIEEACYDSRSRRVDQAHFLCAGDGRTRFIRVLRALPGRSGPRVDLEIMRGDPDDMPPGLFGSDYEPLFFAQGVIAPQGIPIRPTRLAPDLDATGSTYDGRGEFNGRDCIVLKNENLEYWVDLDRQGAVLQFIAHPAAKYVIQIDYQKTPWGWLPKCWTKRQSRTSKLRFIERIDVEKIDAHPTASDEQFQIAPGPGMEVDELTIVKSERTGELKCDARHYRVDPGGGS